MASKFESFLLSFATVILCLIVYTSIVKPYTPKNVQGWIGL